MKQQERESDFFSFLIIKVQITIIYICFDFFFNKEKMGTISN